MCVTLCLLDIVNTLNVYRSIIDGAALSLCGRLREHDNHIPEGMNHPFCGLLIIPSSSSCYRAVHTVSGIIPRLL